MLSRIQHECDIWSLRQEGDAYVFRLKLVKPDIDLLEAKDYGETLVAQINGELVRKHRGSRRLDFIGMGSWFGDQWKEEDIPIDRIIVNNTLSGLTYQRPPASIGWRQLDHLEEERRLVLLRRLWAQPDAENWRGLYSIYEVIDKDPKVGKQIRGKFASEIKRFTQTANHHETGLFARHVVASADVKPHRNPMTLSEANDFIRELDTEYRKTRGWERG